MNKKQIIFLTFFLSQQFVGCVRNKADDDPIEVKIVYLAVVIIIIIVASIITKTKQIRNRERTDYHNTLDIIGQEIHSTILEIQLKYESAEYVFSQNFKHAKSSTNTSFKKEWCEKYINAFELAIADRNQQLRLLKKKYGSSKVEDILQKFKWNNYSINKFTLTYVKHRSTSIF